MDHLLDFAKPPMDLDYSKINDPTGTPTVVRMVTSADGGKTFDKSSIADKSANDSTKQELF